jgi:hypothetical protein
MAVQTIKVVAGNSAPPWLLTAKRAGVAIDVTGATVSLILAKGNTITNAGHQACSLVTPTAGLVKYSPAVTDVPTPGKYKADLKVVYADTTVEILYDRLVIQARKALGT